MKARRVVVESFLIPVATALGSVPRTCELNEIWAASKPSPQPSPDDCLFINAVNQRIRKACKEEPSDFRLNLHARVWIASDESNNTIQFIEEFTTEVFFSCFVPLDCVIDFSVSQAEEADFRNRRYLAITSSYETVE